MKAFVKPQIIERSVTSQREHRSPPLSSHPNQLHSHQVQQANTKTQPSWRRSPMSPLTLPSHLSTHKSVHNYQHVHSYPSKLKALTHPHPPSIQKQCYSRPTPYNLCTTTSLRPSVQILRASRRACAAGPLPVFGQLVMSVLGSQGGRARREGYRGRRGLWLL